MNPLCEQKLYVNHNYVCVCISIKEGIIKRNEIQNNAHQVILKTVSATV